MIVLIRNLRVQLYSGMFLLGYSVFTLTHQPQGFYDYVIRGAAVSLAFFLLFGSFHERQKLSSPERVLVIILFVLVFAAAPTFVLSAFDVRAFSNR